MFGQRGRHYSLGMDDEQLHGLKLVDIKPRHKTATIPGTVTPVPHYPKKLKIYLNNASPYWQAVYWDRGKTYRQSCKTTDKVQAFEVAKVFYEQIILRKYQHPAHLVQYPHISNHHQHKPVKPSFGQMADGWLEVKAANWTPRQVIEVKRRLNNNLLPQLGQKPIDHITKQQLINLLQTVEARGAKNLAKRLLNDCRKIWKYAIAHDACSKDITEGLSLLLAKHKTQHQHAVGVEELPELMLKIANYTKRGEVITKYGLQMLALTFVRTCELIGAEWTEFDLDKRLWRIPAARMKMREEHTVPLSKQAIHILTQIRQQFGDNGYVFKGLKPNAHIPQNRLIEGLYLLGYKGRMTGHGFRAVACTILNEQGFRVDVIEKQLAHKEQNQVRRAYNRAQYLQERTEMMQWWGNYLEKLAPLG